MGSPQWPGEFSFSLPVGRASGTGVTVAGRGPETDAATDRGHCGPSHGTPGGTSISSCRGPGVTSSPPAATV